MRCYLGEGDRKEAWFTHLVPSGMLPALALDGELITESDDILFTLDEAFGPLPSSPPLGDASAVLPLRRLERKLFRSWCDWLCRQNSQKVEERAAANFAAVAAEVDFVLSGSSGSPYFLKTFGIADVIFAPYIERMSASLTYYKGYSLRGENPSIDEWFRAMETRPTYLGTQSDFSTHSHDLPPQMGSCHPSGCPRQSLASAAIDQALPLPEGGCRRVTSFFPFEHETSSPRPGTAKAEALTRVYAHRVQLAACNPLDVGVFDGAVRSALTFLVTGVPTKPPNGTAEGLRYLKDRVSVPRDMSLHAARCLREALERTAALDGDGRGVGISVRDRRDQDPRPFVEAKERRERERESGGGANSC